MIINQLDNTQSSNITISLNSLQINSFNSISKTLTIKQESLIFVRSMINSKLILSQSLPDTVRILS
jgi:hypothetical protein